MAKIDCPHCKHPLRARSSRTVAPTYKQLNLQCTNVECSATYGAELTITHMIAPSARPDPSIQLRMAPARKRPDNDNGVKLPGNVQICGPEVPLPLTANDDDPLGEAVATGG